MHINRATDGGLLRRNTSCGLLNFALLVTTCNARSVPDLLVWKDIKEKIWHGCGFDLGDTRITLSSLYRTALDIHGSRRYWNADSMHRNQVKGNFLIVHYPIFPSSRFRFFFFLFVFFLFFSVARLDWYRACPGLISSRVKTSLYLTYDNITTIIIISPKGHDHLFTTRSFTWSIILGLSRATYNRKHHACIHVSRSPVPKEDPHFKHRLSFHGLD